MLDAGVIQKYEEEHDRNEDGLQIWKYKVKFLVTWGKLWLYCGHNFVELGEICWRV